MPEAIDYVARAKELMKQTARVGALVVMPIGLAVQGHAAVILPANATCTPSLTCSASATQLGEQNGLEGLSLGVGDSEYYAYSSGGSGESTSLTLDSSGLLALDANGSTCNGINEPCQLNSFQISFSGEFQPVSGGSGQPNLSDFITSFDGIGVYVSLDGTPLFSEYLPAANPNASEIGISGSAIVSIPAEFQSDVASLVAGSVGSNVDLSVGFTLNFSTSGPANTLVDGGGGVSITAVDTPTPEPSTSALAMSGLLGLGAWLRRRRRA